MVVAAAALLGAKQVHATVAADAAVAVAGAERPKETALRSAARETRCVREMRGGLLWSVARGAL